jgi:hypothetical protein
MEADRETENEGRRSGRIAGKMTEAKSVWKSGIEKMKKLLDQLTIRRMAGRNLSS